MRKCIILTFTILTLCMLAFLFSCTEEDGVMPAQIDVLKMGKADCIVISTGEKIVMIDTGEEENIDDIRAFMTERGYKKVDTLILTHFDKDHIGGAKDIITEYEVDTVIESTASSDREEYHEYHYALSQLGKTAMRLTQDYTFQSDDCSFYVNVPRQKKYEDNKDNNSSLVIKMECGETKLLFCGDAQELRLAEIVDTCAGEYDFIKLPYHGNYIENYGEFFDKIKTKKAAVTCSKKNPVDERTLALLESCGVTLYETKNGTVTLYTNGSEVTINQ